MPSLIDRITNGRVPRSPFKLAAAAKEEDTATLRKSIFVFDEEEPAAGSGRQLSPGDVAHLMLGHRYGKPFHRMEVEALMQAFEADRDAAHLCRAVSILEHQIELQRHGGT